MFELILNSGEFAGIGGGRREGLLEVFRALAQAISLALRVLVGGVNWLEGVLGLLEGLDEFA